MISILLPTYNGSHRIKEAIKSVTDQTYKNWELLVLDDGSTDNTEEIVREFSLKDERVKYIKNDVNLGIQKTLNKGIHESKGECIARIDDDDVWIDKEKLAKQISFLDDHKDYVLIGTGLIAVNEKGEDIFKHIHPQEDKDIRNAILNKNLFTHSSVLFKKDSALEVGGYNESKEARHIEDYELWLKLGTIGKFANLPSCSVKLVLRNESISSQNKIEQFKKSLNLIKNFKNQYPHYLYARMNLSARMVVYSFLMKYFQKFYSKIYKLYKNI
jgi:glycosyltransferase involved in cell wall biosynthesis